MYLGGQNPWKIGVVVYVGEQNPGNPENPGHCVPQKAKSRESWEIRVVVYLAAGIFTDFGRVGSVGSGQAGANQAETGVPADLICPFLLFSPGKNLSFRKWKLERDCERIKT